MDDHLGVLKQGIETETVVGKGAGLERERCGAAKLSSVRKKTWMPAMMVEA